jgi:glucosamine-6-phosphate deaminase
MGLRVEVVDSAEALALAGANQVADVLDEAPASSVVVATGRTPIGLYEELAARRRAGALDTSRMTAVQLDEYLGLAPDDKRSLLRWMDLLFLEPLGIDPARVVTLPTDGEAGGLTAFDLALEDRGGLDLAILGLGANGHLGFNEPPTAADAGTRAVDLRPETLEANASYWGDGVDVPRRAVTIGMRQLLAARQILLLVAGASKHAIVHAAIEGPVSPDVPASFLQVAADRVTVIVDRAAWEGEV